MSSLSAQLAGIKANNNATILDKSKRRKIHSVSLVYDAREAATQDFESIYYDCLEAFNELQSVDPRFGAFSKSLFSETSIRFDRLTQDASQSEALNSAIDQFLMLVAAYLHLTSAFRALEWLVRRFHVQIHNTESLLLATLPWHDAPEFVRVLDIIAPQNFPPVFQFLAQLKSSLSSGKAASHQSALHGPSRAALVRAVSRDEQLFQAYNNFSFNVFRHNCSFPRQLVLWSGLNVMLTLSYKEQGLSAEAADRLLPVVSDALDSANSRPQVQIAVYMLLSTLVSSFSFSAEVLQAAASAVVSSWTPEARPYGLVCLSLVCAATDATPFFSKETLSRLVQSSGSVSGLVSDILAAMQQHEGMKLGALTNKLVSACLESDPASFPEFLPLVNACPANDLVVMQVAEYALRHGPLEPELNAAIIEYIERCGEHLSKAQIDRLEIALQTSLSVGSSGLEGDETAVQVEKNDGDEEMEDAKEGPKIDILALLEEAGNMEQSTRKTFTDAPLPQSDPHAQLWVRAASSGQARLEELRQVARVSPEAQLSFMLAIAIGPWPSVARAMAVRVSSALVAAVLRADTSAADYQGILPFVLFLLSDRELRVRKEAAQLLRALAQMKPTAKSPKFDANVGVSSGSGNGVWLSKTDSPHIIKKLVEVVEECVLDPDFVIQAARQAGKASWCEFLVAQATHTHLPQLLWILLRCLQQFKGVVKQLSFMLKEWNTQETREKWQQLCKDAKFPLNGVERALIGAIRSNEPCGIEFLLSGMKQHGPSSTAFAELAGRQIVQIWSEVLRDDTKEKVAQELVEMVTDSRLEYDPRDVLAELQPFTAQLFANLLANSSSSISNVNKPSQLFSESSKRRRRRSSSSVHIREGPQQEIAAVAEQHLRRTTVILELIEKNSLKLTDSDGVAKLLTTLFDVLEELMALGEGSQLPVLYTEELLASCMIGLVNNLKVHKCTSRELNSLKVSTLVSCIRTSSSPQVQNRLLLVVAALATLCPDAVLHGVMPIFTFMGAKTVRLDNDFSAHVIQQTIEQVIPALVAAGDKHEEIEMALLSFVAAFPHIPRHRRNSLFGALIKTLGPQQSLYKLLLLLGQRFAESNSSRRTADAKALVYFATPFLRSFGASEQLDAMNSYVQFVSNTSTSDDNNKNDDGRFGLLKIREALQSKPLSAPSLHLRNSLYEFLARTAGEPEPIAGTQPLRITIPSTISSSSEDWRLPTEIIGALLEEIGVYHEHGLYGASDLLVRVLEILPIVRFVEVVKPLAGPTDLQVLDLIKRKFSHEPQDDAEVTTAARNMLEHLISVIQTSSVQSYTVIDTAESILSRFGAQLRDLESQLLEQLVGRAGILSNDRMVELSAIATISTICRHLGAALYGFFPRFFPTLCLQVRGIISNRSREDEDGDLQVALFALFAGLVRQMPRFMAPETQVMVELILSSEVGTQPRVQTLRVLEEKLDPRTLLAALCKSWAAAQHGGMPGVQLLFMFLNSSIEKIERRELAEEMPQLTALAISCLGTRQQLESAEGNMANQDVANQVEARINECVLLAYMKLNDRVVRPQFRRVVQWGFEAASDARHLSVLKFVLCVFDRLKSVVTNYAGYILDDVCKLLDQSVSANSSVSAGVRKLLLQCLTSSFSNDQDDFWQSPARFGKVYEALLAQLAAEPQTHGSLVVKCITALALASSAQHRKQINDGLAQLLSAEASTTKKIWTIKAFSSLYRKLGEAWMPNLPQLVPLIAELLDDEDESVELETRKSLVPVIEGVLGESLDKYLA